MSMLLCTGARYASLATLTSLLHASAIRDTFDVDNLHILNKSGLTDEEPWTSSAQFASGFIQETSVEALNRTEVQRHKCNKLQQDRKCAATGGVDAPLEKIWTRQCDFTQCKGKCDGEDSATCCQFHTIDGTDTCHAYKGEAMVITVEDADGGFYAATCADSAKAKQPPYVQSKSVDASVDEDGDRKFQRSGSFSSGTQEEQPRLRRRNSIGSVSAKDKEMAEAAHRAAQHVLHTPFSQEISHRSFVPPVPPRSAVSLASTVCKRPLTATYLCDGDEADQGIQSDDDIDDGDTPDEWNACLRHCESQPGTTCCELDGINGACTAFEKRYYKTGNSAKVCASPCRTQMATVLAKEANQGETSIEVITDPYGVGFRDHDVVEMYTGDGSDRSSPDTYIVVNTDRRAIMLGSGLTKYYPKGSKVVKEEDWAVEPEQVKQKQTQGEKVTLERDSGAWTRSESGWWMYGVVKYMENEEVTGFTDITKVLPQHVLLQLDARFRRSKDDNCWRMVPSHDGALRPATWRPGQEWEGELEREFSEYGKLFFTRLPPPQGLDRGHIRLIIFDFDNTLSVYHVFKGLVGWRDQGGTPGGYTKPTRVMKIWGDPAQTELGQMMRVAEYDKVNGRQPGDFAKIAFGGEVRVRQLKETLEYLKIQRRVHLVIVTKGLVGVVRELLSDFGMLELFTDVYGNVGWETLPAGATAFPFDLKFGHSETEHKKLAMRYPLWAELMGEKKQADFNPARTPTTLKRKGKAELIKAIISGKSRSNLPWNQVQGQGQGLQPNQVVFVEDDPAEIYHATGLALILEVKDRQGMHVGHFDTLRHWCTPADDSPPTWRLDTVTGLDWEVERQAREHVTKSGRHFTVEQLKEAHKKGKRTFKEIEDFLEFGFDGDWGIVGKSYKGERHQDDLDDYSERRQSIRAAATTHGRGGHKRPPPPPDKRMKPKKQVQVVECGDFQWDKECQRGQGFVVIFIQPDIYDPDACLTSCEAHESVTCCQFESKISECTAYGSGSQPRTPELDEHKSRRWAASCGPKQEVQDDASASTDEDVVPELLEPPIRAILAMDLSKTTEEDRAKDRDRLTLLMARYKELTKGKQDQTYVQKLMSECEVNPEWLQLLQLQKSEG